MRLSPSTRRLLEIDLQNAYHQHGLRSIAALAAHVKRSRSFVYNYVRDNPSLFPDLAINQRRPSPVARPTLLNEAQLRLLFNTAESPSLIPVRRAARELFGLELLDTTAYKYIRLYKDGLLFAPHHETRGRKPLLDDEQFQALVTHFQHPANACTTQAMAQQMEELLGRPVPRSTLYYYRRQVLQHVQPHAQTRTVQRDDPPPGRSDLRPG